jgi:NDP-sugar pyrophosphorylase family protein
VPNPTIILAAGLGSRMKADPRRRPKAMTLIGIGRMGMEQTPFLAILLRQLRAEGCTDVCVVVHPIDEVTRQYFNAHPLEKLKITYAIQPLIEGRDKPMGTAHAVACGLESRPDWAGQCVAVCNGDNLPPTGAFSALFGATSLGAMQVAMQGALLAFDSAGLGLPADRTRGFAVIHTDAGNRLTDIVEKPSDVEIEASRTAAGTVRVSMNLFSLGYEAFLQSVHSCPINPERDEKELPTAMLLWSRQHPGKLACIPFSGRFLDLTRPEDIAEVEQGLRPGARD